MTSQDRVELIRGEIIPMSPIGLKHAATVKRLNNLLAIQLQDLAIISVQDPIQLDNYSETQPDIVLLKPRADFYETQMPQPQGKSYQKQQKNVQSTSPLAFSDIFLITQNILG